MKLAGFNDIREIIFPLHPSAEASLSVYEHPKLVPFPIARVFTVTTEQNCTRGFHAHKDCTQLMVCLSGSITLKIKDGQNEQDFLLDNPKKGVLVPPSLWGEQTYKAGSLLMVLTDRVYDEQDYIRDYNEYLKYRGVQ